jgi:CelD/BcsL family acetyltransferase involved in cellulose biosynthesis
MASRMTLSTITCRTRDSRRRLRKLEKRASIRFEIACTGKDRQRFFDAMVRMKRRRFADTAANDIFSDSGYWRFHAEATRRLGAAGTVQLSALIADNQIIAANWGIVAGERYYDLVPSYETGEWKTYAPGRLLTEWLLRQHAERGDRIFDYGIGDERYKFDYCNLRTPLTDAYIPVTIKGSAYNRLLQLRLAAKSRLRDTKLGGVLKAARSLLTAGRSSPMPPSETLPAWIALLGSVTLVVDA